MSKLKVTQWFGPAVKPMLEGVYQRDYGKKEGGVGIVFSYWNGQRWGIYGWSEVEAKNLSGIQSGHQLKWRGLAEKP